MRVGKSYREIFFKIFYFAKWEVKKRLTNVLSEQVAKTIRAQISRQIFKVGTYLPSERVLADKLGVSRNVLREGLQILEAQGYIVSQPGKRRVVIQKNVDIPAWLKEHLSSQQTTIAHLLETRYIIEPKLAYLSTQRIVPTLLLPLHDSINQMDSYLGDPFLFIQSDRDFHLYIAMSAKNPILEMIMVSMLEFTTRLRLLLVQRSPDSIVQSQTMHRAILAAIEARNAEAAADAMRQHISQVQEDVLQLSSEGLLDPLDWPLD